MSIKTKHRVIVIIGPTASGKSDLAVTLAKKLNGEVVSADSRQVYRGLDIGSGKITHREMRGVRHHLLDVASPRGLFTAARYRTLARRAVREIMQRGKLPIIAGGTGLYIDSLIYDSPIPEVAPDLKLRARLEKKTITQLYAQLKKLDPRRAGNIESKNKRRLVRALEIVLRTGRPVPELSERKPVYDAVKIGINLPSEELKRRIRARLTKRLKQGMLREVQGLRKSGLSWKRLDDLGLEYRYASRHLRGFISRVEMIAAIEKESWKYARRQMTWWRKDKEIAWARNGREALALAKSLSRA
jgi:tRNA dimethylallyltransferase